MKDASVFLDYATVSHDDVDPQRLSAALPGLKCFDTSTPAELPARLASAQIVLLNKIVLDAGRLAQAPNLKLICAAATGTDNIDLAAAAKSGIAVCNIRDYCTRSVAQHVFAMILSLTHHLSAYQQLLRDGAWRGSPQFCLLDFPVRELDGKVMGIVGAGTLGKAVADIAKAFGMHVRFAKRPGQDDRPDRVALSTLLPQADILSLHCPLTPVTRHLIGAPELSQMKPDALLINSARGALIDAHALASALQRRQLGGAGIDVLEKEPPVDGNVLLDQTIPNLIVTPHIAWSAVEARQRALDEIALNVESWRGGGQRNRVI